ncbi:MAG: ComEC/Rec2 family competence protein [Marivibrio sp.]|uniref:ComEC/Rec2 family competence protein n=1 Tax=Marivibrio sp. TaxID=2039719 RepID=UPI0032EB28A3
MADALRPAFGAARALRGRAALIEAFAAERDRWALWLPVLFGAGIGLYFASPVEPPPGLGLGAAVAGAVAFWAARRAGGTLSLILAASLLAGGLGVERAALETRLSERPTLNGDAGAVRLSGLVRTVEAFEDGPRVTLVRLAYQWRAPTPAPEVVRVRLRAGEFVSVGERIELTAVLRAPPRPAYPDAYDFARRAWFEGLGAVGFALSEIEAAPPDPRPLGLGLRLGAWVDGVRQILSRRVRAALPGESGDVAAALITGDRSGLDEASVVAMRDSGLAHLLAISGLHIGMVAGIVFVALRMALASSERLALGYPIKKWAAGAAILTAFVYLLLAGATTPTQRAFLMTGLALAAVMLDRKAISLRLVAIAAAVVLLWRPQALVGASFQMSFAAVVALVAVYESWRPYARREGAREVDGWARALRKMWLGLLLIGATTLIAGAATAPFAWAHFGRVANYGLLGNLAAVPIMGWVVMPAAILGVLLTPLRLEQWPLYVMGVGVDAILAVAHWVAALPGAAIQVAAAPDWAAVLITGGCLWAAIWRGRWRYWGALPAALGLTLPLTTAQPQIVVSETGRLAAAAGPEGGLWLSHPRRESFAAGVWSERTGRPIAGGWDDLIARTGGGAGAPIACGPLGCVYRAEGRTVAWSHDPRTLSEDCRSADVVVATITPPPALLNGACAGRLVLGPADRARDGTIAIRLERDGPLALRTVRHARGDRPWTRGRDGRPE